MREIIVPMDNTQKLTMTTKLEELTNIGGYINKFVDVVKQQTQYKA